MRGNSVTVDFDMLMYADDNLTTAIFKLFFGETFVYAALNRANREKDESKIENLGPYAYVLGVAIDIARQR